MKWINKGIITGLLLSVGFSACNIPKLAQTPEQKPLPESYTERMDTTNSAIVNPRDFFTDSNLIALINYALVNNQELNIILWEMQLAKNEVSAKKGEYLPKVNLQGGAGVDKVGRYTRSGTVEANHDIAPGEEFPEPYTDLQLGLYANWEVDIWKKLRNARSSAAKRYLATIEGKNYMVTQLVSEIASTYYELLAMDNQLAIVNRNIKIQQRALEIVKLQKQAAKTTELAVRKFEAEVFKNQSKRFDLEQKIIELENKINFLVGRQPQKIERTIISIDSLQVLPYYSGIPSQLLLNRPDIREAQYNLEATKLDVKVAKANFYPALRIDAGLGYQGFNMSHLFQSPQSLVYSAVGDLVAPLINRKGIKATYLNANAKQIQGVYQYEQTVLNAYVEVVNQLSKIDNLDSSFHLKTKQVEALTRSIEISNGLFKSARADYMEVLMTQRDALEAKMELIETRKEQMNAVIKMYKALGGGWQ